MIRRLKLGQDKLVPLDDQAETHRSMSVRKLASGRWFAELKAGRAYVAGKAFDTKREAQAWYNRERAALAGGVDPSCRSSDGADFAADLA